MPGCVSGPSGLAINNSDQLLGACDNGVALIDANSGKVTILGEVTGIGGADEIWFDPGSNAWYVSAPGGKLGVVSNSPGNPIQVVIQPGAVAIRLRLSLEATTKALSSIRTPQARA